MEAVDILKAGADTLIEEGSSSCSMDSVKDSARELRRQRQITQTTKERLAQSVQGAIGELNQIVGALSSQAKLGSDTSYINAMLYNSLILLLDELDYIADYVQRIENQIDTACFDIAKKLNESIVHLIGHRKDILFKVIETTYKIHDYILKWKRIVNDTMKMDDGEEGTQDYIEGGTY